MFRVIGSTAFLVFVAMQTLATPPVCQVRSVLHESREIDPSNHSGGFSIGGGTTFTQYLASRFHVGSNLNVTAIGGQIAGSSFCSGNASIPGPIFAAVIKLSDMNAVPAPPSTDANAAFTLGAF